MHVLVIGALGQLGTEICDEMAGETVVRADLDEHCDVPLDIRDAAAVRETILGLKPDLVINTAAAHELQACEDNPEIAFAVNATGAMHVAKACGEVGARVVYISTDYIFDGNPPKPQRPYIETDLPAPVNVYAASKLAGEHLTAATCSNHIILRTAALYGLAPCRGKNGRNFIETMLGLAATHNEVKVVTDVFITPTYTAALARQLHVLAERGTPGIYHATCNPVCSWYDFAKAIFEETHTPVNLVAATSHDFQSPVRRPLFTALENRRAQDHGLDIMPTWREALKEYTVARQKAQRATVS